MPLPAGTRLGSYEILSPSGAGGMGEVYRARDTKLGRDVALKVLSPAALADESNRKRFRKEALLLSQLSHPNIAVIYDFDTQGGVDFLVMEWVAGETLAQKLTRGAFPENQARDWGAQIADALEEAHEHSIIHRDLKPGNVMVTAKGRVKVLDFGVAKLLRPVAGEAATAATLAETQWGTAMGTVPYMAPEQLQGRPADARTDIWALGAVLYEMVTGRRPFPERQPAQLGAAILTKQAQPPRELNGQVSPGLETTILRALEKNPAARYPSAKALREDLERVGAAEVAAAPGQARRARRILAGAGIVALLAVLAGLNWGRLRELRPGQGGQPHIDSIAVLPLQNLSGDPAQEYFADGMTEELITDLAKVSALKVISRTSVMPYKNTGKSVREIAGELRVGALIEGSVTRSADRVRITVQLIDASSDRHLWAESYDRELKNVFALQGDVAEAIAKQVRAVITPQEQSQIVKHRPIDPEVYELYLKGRHIMMRGGLKDVRTAIDYFQSGLAKDPNNALIYTGLADAYIQQMSDVHESPVEATARARAAATKALDLDESLAEAHTSLGYIILSYDWDWTGGQTEFKRAMELNPGYAEAYVGYGEYLTMVGRQPEAPAYFERARQLDPLDPLTYRAAGYSYFMAHQYDKAVEQYRKGLEMEPDQTTYFGLVLALAEKGDFAAAISEAEKGTKRNDSPLLLTGLASAYARAGRRADANRVLRQLDEISRHQGPAPAWHVGGGHSRYVCPYEVAGVCAQLGDKNRAFEWLGKAYQSRSCLYWLRTDPRLDSLRSDPRFQDLLSHMNFPH